MDTEEGLRVTSPPSSYDDWLMRGLNLWEKQVTQDGTRVHWIEYFISILIASYAVFLAFKMATNYEWIIIYLF